MDIPASEKLFELAGFMLADALVKASEAGEGRAFDPYAGVVKDGEFHMAGFSPESEENPDSGAQALRYLLSHPEEFLAWALVQDTFVLNLGRKEDLRGLKAADISSGRIGKSEAVSVTAWEQDLEEPFTVIQRYSPRRSGRFRMIGKPTIAFQDAHFSETDCETAGYLGLLRTGFMNHEEAAEKWERWA